MVQESLGSEGVILLKNVVEVQLALSNRVLLVVTDPTLAHVLETLRALDDPNLTTLDLTPRGSDIYDWLDISVKIKDSRQALCENLGGATAFVVLLSLNPFFLNMEPRKVLRILSDNLQLAIENQTVDLVLMQKGLVPEITQAQLTSLVHGVIDLQSVFEGNRKVNTLRILKMHGQKFDLNVVPYEIFYDTRREHVSFLIKSAFLASFETFRTLIHWDDGQVKLAQFPYLFAPINYFNAFLEIPVDLDHERGRDEVLEKAQGIGRNLTRSVADMYFLEGSPLFVATLRTAALQGWGEGEVVSYELEENLIEIRQRIPAEFNRELYEVFLDGLYRGVIRAALQRQVRFMRVLRDVEGASNNYVILQFRLRPPVDEPGVQA